VKPANLQLALAVLAFLLLPCAGVTRAAKPAVWTFEVVEISRVDRDEALIRLRPRPPGRKFPRSCEIFHVHARYDLETWSLSARRAVTREGHERSLRLLEQAQATGDIVRFGAVGRGFGTIVESTKCEVGSRGLQIVVEDGGTPVVYSVFEEPR
jgi:hypothetical protein